MFMLPSDRDQQPPAGRLVGRRALALLDIHLGRFNKFKQPSCRARAVRYAIGFGAGTGECYEVLSRTLGSIIQYADAALAQPRNVCSVMAAPSAKR
jgi:hypothetical protein